tara:strand:+ start:11782 stop:12909 length:1128 start_codon:yes stop_codon:yes gene_type:complete
MEKEIEEVEKYFKKKAYYNKLKANQITKIRKNNTLTKEEKRKKALSLKLPCIFCKKKIGTIFEKKEGYLIARCGSEDNGCSEIIKIRVYKHIPAENIKNIYFEDISILKEEIIELKCNTLFKYISDEYAVKKFEKLNEDLAITSDIYLHILRKYTNHVSNINYIDEELEDLLKDYENNIKNIKNYYKKYKEELNEHYLNEIANIYKNNLIPLNEKIRKKKYKNMELIHQEENNKHISKLKYNTHTPEDVEEFYDVDEDLKSNTSSKSDSHKKMYTINEEVQKDLNPPSIINNMKEKEEDKLQIDGNKILFKDKIIADKNDFEKNKELLQKMAEINATEANKNKYQFEMIKVEESKPELIAINPESGEMYRVIAGQ